MPAPMSLALQDLGTGSTSDLAGDLRCAALASASRPASSSSGDALLAKRAMPRLNCWLGLGGASCPDGGLGLGLGGEAAAFQVPSSLLPSGVVAGSGIRSRALERDRSSLSRAACRENAKSQWCALTRLDQGRGISVGAVAPRTPSAGATAASLDLDCSSPSGAGTEDAAARAARAFQEGARAIEQLLEGVGRSGRMDYLLDRDAQEARKRALALEEERRQQELELRRARRRERDIRDPHKKVALKLENRRRFERDMSMRSEAIPTCRVDFAGGAGGLERVELVDVGQLRARCHQLGEGDTVKTLLDRQRRNEQRERLSSSTSRLPSRGAVAGGLCLSSSSPQLVNASDSR
eukprot:TRINITY_DN5299_c0_g2_i1.p2 TRINITY_DN5299_c0_g2~~TRINITY_DN5299_c0_g2_i1.p2  ORF type:complete len:351 (-),score=90.79 TRINITY_DN5299_c0_g2_i1:107-1159(-)